MTKKIIKVGNSATILFDDAFMKSAGLKVGDQFAVMVHAGGTISLTPLSPRPARVQTTKGLRKIRKRNS